MRQKRLLGFTLIEILTVITIFGILVTITSYIYSSALQRSRDNQRMADMSSIKNALEQFYLTNRHYPVNSSYLPSTETARPWVAKNELELYNIADCASGAEPKLYLAPTYISTIPEDPRHNMQSVIDANGGCKFSLGRDGYGQYTYVSLVRDQSQVQRPGRYYLMARLERADGASEISPMSSIASQFQLTSSKLQQWNGSRLGYCAKTGSPLTPANNPDCSHNYYLSSSNND